MLTEEQILSIVNRPVVDQDAPLRQFQLETGRLIEQAVRKEMNEGITILLRQVQDMTGRNAMVTRTAVPDGWKPSHQELYTMSKDAGQLTVMPPLEWLICFSARVLAAAPQPATQPRIPFAGYDPKFCPGSNPDNSQLWPDNEAQPTEAVQKENR